MSVSSGEGQNIPYEPPLNAEEVYCILLHKLGAENEKLNDHAKQAENTQSVDSWRDIRGSDSAEALLKLKNKVYEAMRVEFDKQVASSFHSLDRYLEEKVTCSFKELCSRNEALISYLENEIKVIQRMTSLANDRAEDLRTSLAEKQEKGRMSKEELEAGFKKKQELVAKKHRKLVRGVRSVTSFAYPRTHRDLDLILGTLLESSFTPDAYVDVEEGWGELVEFLLLTGMVVRHPDNKSKIRLIDFA